MQGLLAGVEGRDAQALDGGRELMQASHLFVEGEPRQKVVDALRESQLCARNGGGLCAVCADTWDSLEVERRVLSKRFDGCQGH
jgi:hypothetical protein